MTVSSYAASSLPDTPHIGVVSTGYRPGVCNIGPAEIARRRRAGHVGLVATLVVFLAAIAINAPPPVRLIVALPLAGAASGYLQAWLRFCAGFGSRGLFNFGPPGATSTVADAAARRADRRRANQIALASLAIGLLGGLVAQLLPL
jgi:hypothetical protein